MRPRLLPTSGGSRYEVVGLLVTLSVPVWVKKPKRPQSTGGEPVTKGRYVEVRSEDSKVSQDRTGDAVTESWVKKGPVHASFSKTATGHPSCSRSFETSDADRRDPGNRLVEDVNGDGWDDYRDAKTPLPHCRSCWTFLRNPQKEEFNFACKLSSDTGLGSRSLGRKCLRAGGGRKRIAEGARHCLS